MRTFIKLIISIHVLFFVATVWATEPDVTVFPDTVTHDTVTIDGKSYPYTTRAGTISLYNGDDRPVVHMFYTANTLDGAKTSKRPITFFSNGGPGASTMLLRMASFGPKHVLFNPNKTITSIPYRLKDNPYSLLDKTDMVFIDMPGTGFGRITPYGRSSDFHTVDNDVNAFSSFIKLYITKNHRWNSPKFLFGESYGTTRTAILVDELQKYTQINGVVLQSSILNYGLMGDRAGGGDWQYVLYLPTLAATAWHFNASNYHPDSLEALMAEVKKFAITEYLEALAEGSSLSAEKFTSIADKLHRYLGLSTDYLRHKNLRVSGKQFSVQLLHEQQKKLGRFDSRFSFYALDKGTPTSINKRDVHISESSDPSSVAIKTAIIAANNDYLRTHLDYDPSLNYIHNLKLWPTWEFDHHDQLVVNASYDLASALIENPNLRVFSANGYYDLATPFFATIYTLDHLNLTPELQSHISYGFYEAGHMIYLETEELPRFKKDLANWYDATLKLVTN
jgi:carboxypeptidase C (cathepsin A)